MYFKVNYPFKGAISDSATVLVFSVYYARLVDVKVIEDFYCHLVVWMSTVFDAINICSQP